MAYDCKRTAERLKDLRKQKGISHDKLSMAIKEQYDVNVSKGTLINYENSEDFGVKAGSAKGMSAERLAVLADFYGVSTDYLLGISDSPSIRESIRIAQKTLGISADSAENLAKVAKAKRYPAAKLNPRRLGAALDLLLSSSALERIAESLYHLWAASENMRALEQWSVEELKKPAAYNADMDCDAAFADYRLARLDITESIQALMDGDTTHFLSAQDAKALADSFYARLEEAERLQALEDAAAEEKFNEEEREYQDYLEREGLDEEYGSDETADD